MNRLRKLGLGGWSAVATIAASAITILAFLYGAADLLRGSGSSGASEAPIESVEDFATRALLTFHGGDWAAYWRLLDPAVREAIPEDRFVGCEEQAGAPANLIDQRFVGSWESSGIEMEGVPSTATGVKFLVDAEIPEGRTSLTVIFDITYDGEEMGLLPTQAEYDAYAEGRCPTPRLETLERS